MSWERAVINLVSVVGSLTKSMTQRIEEAKVSKYCGVYGNIYLKLSRSGSTAVTLYEGVVDFECIHLSV